MDQSDDLDVCCLILVWHGSRRPGALYRGTFEAIRDDGVEPLDTNQKLTKPEAESGVCGRKLVICNSLYNALGRISAAR